jgi:hypothetical protein
LRQIPRKKTSAKIVGYLDVSDQKSEARSKERGARSQDGNQRSEVRHRRSEVPIHRNRCGFKEVEESSRRRFDVVTQRENGDESKFFDESE